ncbi:PhnD/SsuA/transferrin family substrate-binding protein [Rhodovastum atsumiense]|uniref:PhnD/SsuA/transferrin family substrate-binding protein n=1 Tax=Rhodovastum atsumiense TaxID=504468 RepID=A0A5M6IK77_9PROT|nr:ABC transporter substrate-binding protein [Rhodovastum atsumiense]KAA5608650.1 PhnD/SsuA/transferrin family substrate-binding protein [Rhodovastum atsumiense]CAH2598805.1 PhnD/SsuA/transferrin family substrate-binding protein [Rhodovastum atsumiense]
MTFDPSRRAVLGTALGLATAVLARPWVARAAKPPINIGFFTETKPTNLVRSQGLLEKATGQTVNWTEYGSGAEINAAIAAGGADIGFGSGSVPVAAAISQGLPVQLVGLVDNIGPAEELTVRTAANIRTVADLKGRKVAAPFGSTSHFRLLGLLKLNGLTQRDVTVLDLRGDAIVAAWTRGDIDAAYIWAPAKSKLLANGGTPFRTWDKLDAAGYVIADTILARTGFAEQQPQAVTALLKASGQTLDYYRAQPQQATAEIARTAGVSPEVAAADLKEYEFLSLSEQLKPEWLGPPGKPGRFAEVLRHTAEFLVEQKSIRSAAPLATYQKAIHTEYLKQALA